MNIDINVTDMDYLKEKGIKAVHHGYPNEIELIFEDNSRLIIRPELVGGHHPYVYKCELKFIKGV